MPQRFTPNDYVDMLLIYGECRKNCREAERVYRQRFPDRPTPSYKSFSRVEEKMRTGFFPNLKHSHHQKAVRTEENVVNVLAYVAVNPHVSIRTLARECNISRSTIQRILRENKFHPFKIHLVQGLRPTDFERRLEFIATLRVAWYDNPEILSQICWTDESRFHNNGVVNKHNAHYWSENNPRWMMETRFQTIFGINVWAGIFHGYFIGPYFYEGTLTSERYLDFLQNLLPAFLEDIPILERRLMIWQQDGAPPHNAQRITEYLDIQFPQRWIGNRGPIKWPARSPDMTPMDFFIWGYLKDVVYQRQSNNVEELKNRIREACQTITAPMITAACSRGIFKRYEACVEAGGAQFEHFIK